MKERDLRNLLLEQSLPDEHIAEERPWDAVRAAFANREPVRHPRRVPWRLIIALAIVGGGVAVGVSPAGSDVADWVRDKVGREHVVGVETPAEPALVALPAAGRVLVTAPNGVWVVHDDGSKRRLGDYTGATWSPNGKFVGAWTETELVALDPEATDALHWTITHEGIGGARWAPSGFRVAYLAEESLRVVVGNGTGDRELVAKVAPVLPAWKPGAENVLAYSDPRGRIVVTDVDSGKVLWRTPRAPLPIALAWAPDGEQLVVLSEQRLRVFKAPRTLVSSLSIPRRLYTATALAIGPSGEIAYSVHSERTGQGDVFVESGGTRRQLFSGAGRFDAFAWSPDGSLLLVPWERADQWLYVPLAEGQSVLATSDVVRQFAPGAGETGEGAGFPRVEGWCCPEGEGQ